MSKNVVPAIILGAIIIAGAILYSSGNLPIGPYAEVKSHVASNLKDPGSAEFRNLRKTKFFGYCGEVNAKNSLGGYVGYTKFHAFKSSDTGEWHVIFANEGEELGVRLVDISCQ